MPENTPPLPAQADGSEPTEATPTHRAGHAPLANPDRLRLRVRPERDLHLPPLD